MTTANLSMPPYLQICDESGVPYAGALVYTYVAGSDTPKTTYTDMSSGIPASNPVVADSAGRVALWLNTDGLYKLVIKDASDNLLYTQDNVGTGGAAGGTSLVINTVVGYSDSLKSLSAHASDVVTVLGYRTVSDNGGGTFRWSASAAGGDDGVVVNGNTTYGSTGRWIRLIEGDVDPKIYGVYGDGITNDKPYIDLAVTYARSTNKSLHMTTGNYLLLSDTTFTGVPVILDPFAKFVWSSFNPEMTVIIQEGDNSRHFDAGLTLDYTPALQSGLTISPRWFGSAADGATDDSLAINQAIKSASYHSGTVIIEGTSLIDYNIIPQSNVSLIGSGDGAIIIKTGFGGTYIIGSDTDTADNFEIKKLKVTGLITESNGGIVLLGNNNTVESCIVDDCGGDGIRIGSLSILSTGINAVVRNNIVTNCGATTSSCIAVVQGENVIVEGNQIQSGSFTSRYGIRVVPYVGSVKDVTIRNNNLNTMGIDISSSSDDIIGTVTVNNNVVSTDTTCISIQSNAADTASAYFLQGNNCIGAPKGLILDTLSKPVMVDSNMFVGSADSTAITEIGVTDVSYGTNLFNGVSDWYATSQPRWCTLGTNLRSQIDGDTTCLGSMAVSDNITVGGSIVNTALNNIFRTKIVGFKLENYGVSSSKVIINPGTCLSLNGYSIISSSQIIKDTTSVWSEGSGNGGMGYNAWGGQGNGGPIGKSWHCFVLGKSSDPTAVDGGFDDNTSATNLMSVASSAGYNIYRRLGSIVRGPYNHQVTPFNQLGDNFYYMYYGYNTIPGNVSIECSSLPTTDVTRVQLLGCPYGLPMEVTLLVSVSDTASGNSLYVGNAGVTSIGFFDKDFLQYAYHNILGNYGTNGFGAQAINVVTDTTGCVLMRKHNNNGMTAAAVITSFTDTRDQNTNF